MKYLNFISLALVVFLSTSCERADSPETILISPNTINTAIAQMQDQIAFHTLEIEKLYQIEYGSYVNKIYDNILDINCMSDSLIESINDGNMQFDSKTIRFEKKKIIANVMADNSTKRSLRVSQVYYYDTLAEIQCKEEAIFQIILLQLEIIKYLSSRRELPNATKGKLLFLNEHQVSALIQPKVDEYFDYKQLKIGTIWLNHNPLDSSLYKVHDLQNAVLLVLDLPEGIEKKDLTVTVNYYLTKPSGNYVSLYYYFLAFNRDFTD